MHPPAALVAIVALTALAFGIVAALRLERPWLQPVAMARAIVQLGLLSLILLGVVSDPRWVAVFLTVMVVAAAWVVSRRLALGARTGTVIAGVIAIAAAAPVVLVFVVGALDPTSRYVLALAGIVIGNSMTVCTLMGRSLAASFVTARDEVEGWLALGATPRAAVVRLVRESGSTALIPSVDQTRTTGLVTLPGAFVGALFGGASPLEAALFQLIVLASILVAGALCVVAFALLFGAPRVIPVDRALRA